MSIVGIDIGGTKCAVAGTDAAGNLQGQRRFATRSLEQTLADLLAAVAALEPGPNPLMGVSCGGPLDSRAGTILSPPNLPGWDNVPIAQVLTERFGGRAFLMNDACAGALAEWHFGAARGCRNVVFLTHGTGLGAGLILDGRLYEGATGDAGEIGHVRLADDGPTGYGKAGSVEGFCSGGGIARLAAQLDIADTANRNGGQAVPRTARDIVRGADAGNARSRAVLAESGRRLGEALALLVDLLNPDMIVLGSIYVRARRHLETAMREALEREALARPRLACRIRPAALGEELGCRAALAAALYRTGQLS